jgi:hypothetical protein
VGKQARGLNSKGIRKEREAGGSKRGGKKGMKKTT